MKKRQQWSLAKKIGLGVVGVLVVIAASALGQASIKRFQSTPSDKPYTLQSISSSQEEIRERLLIETNKHRTTPLTLDPALNNTAKEKCEEIVNTGSADHNELQGVADKLNRIMGENLGEYYSTPRAIVNAWAASPTHNDNLVDLEWKHVGFHICFSDKLDFITVQHFSN